MNPDYVSRHFQTLCRQAGVPVRFHDARHVSITLAPAGRGAAQGRQRPRRAHVHLVHRDRDVYVDHAVNRKAAEQIAAVFDLGAHRARNEQAGTGSDGGGRAGKEAV